MNKLSTQYIDRKKLATRVIVARKEASLSQKEVGARSGVHPNYISLIENSRLGFKHPEHMTFVSRVAKFLNIEIPYVSENGEEPESISVKSFDELKDILDKRNSTEPEQKLPPKVDPELYVIKRCSEELEKIDSVRGRSRVINYLEDKYVLAHLNNETEENDE